MKMIQRLKLDNISYSNHNNSRLGRWPHSFCWLTNNYNSFSGVRGGKEWSRLGIAIGLTRSYIFTK